MEQISATEKKETPTPLYKAGQVFEAKKPKKIGWFQEFDDRQILHVSEVRVPRNVDHGFTEEFKAWCKETSFRYEYSEISQIEYEKETGKECKNLELVYDYMVQYDSPTVKNGKNYPSVTQTVFEKWAGREVTELMPKGEWRK